ncbi:MAG: YfcE family phosphodiesterase [Candidatus Moraniibacteriota bacterium]
MLIAIISDIHDNETNLKKVLDYCRENKITKIVCCGDLASDETLDFMADNFGFSTESEIFYTFGNADEDRFGNLAIEQYNKSGKDFTKYKNVKIFREYGETAIERNAIAFVHFPDKAKKLGETGKYNFVFYGHTHRPWEESVSDCKILNPGNVTGQYYLPTFAVWDTNGDDFKLIRIHDLN